MDPDQPPQEALAQLDDLVSQVDNVADRCRKLLSHQQLFAVQQADFKDTHELYEWVS